MSSLSAAAPASSLSHLRARLLRWLTDMTKLKDMLKFKEDPKLHAEWMEMSLGPR